VTRFLTSTDAALWVALASGYWFLTFLHMLLPGLPCQVTMLNSCIHMRV
jgi:hypothetical protein